MPNSMSDIKPAFLVLEDGSVYPGEAFGADAVGHGEVVFNTSMTGYQEVLTDPSYAGQLVTLTYPLVGNYGVNQEDFESRNIQVSGLIVREHCDRPSHGRSRWTLHQYLESQGIPGISGVDTRAITRRLRSQGVMTGVITSDSPASGHAFLLDIPKYDDIDFVRTVTTDKQYLWDEPPLEPGAPGHRIVVTDCGLKYNILRNLRARGCSVTAVPARTTAQEVLNLQPDGVIFSPGPGDPALLIYAVEMVKGLIGKVPVMGICLGHQLLARAFGANTYKLKFGHHGGNHPIKDLATGRVHISAQNHGFAVDEESLPVGLEVSHVNLNDGTVEGIVHRELPAMGIQFHSEAAPGPWDNEYLFDRFLSMVKEVARS